LKVMPAESGPLDEPLLTAREVRKLLGDIPPKTVLQYARQGRLPCLKIGRHVRFVRSELDHALRTQHRAETRA
jgi:excisionase family DNA binding protein